MPSATESKLGYARIFPEHGSERLLQRVEPRLVVPPLLHPVAEYRASHLFGACRANGALVLMETQHSFLERQAAVLEQAAHLTLGVLDHVLVENPVHAAGKHGVKVLHEL